MKTKILKNANYIGWIVIILTFVFIYVAYFFMYIPKQESQLQQKGFRILKEYGSNMMGKHNYFETHFKNYGIYYSIRFLENTKEITKRGDNRRNKTRSTETDKVVTNLQSYVVTNKYSKNAPFYYSNKNGELLLSFHNRNTEPYLIGLIKDIYKNSGSESIDSILNKNYSHNVPIENFMDKLKFDKLFENIILFDESHIAYNSDKGRLADITNPKILSDSSNIKQGGIYKTLNISGEDKHIMILPIDFLGSRFHIAGFISDTDYHNKTHTINKQFLIFIAAILLLIFAGMPILKIIFIDDKERLKASDASGSSISLLFGIGLFLLLIMAFTKRHFVDHTIQNRRITNISNSLLSNVTSDIDSIKALGISIANGKKTQYSELADKVTKVFKSNLSFYQNSNLSCPFPLNEIILIDNEGIFTKGYTRTPFSDIIKVDLSERQYFKNIKNINNSWPTSDSLNFYIESIKSFNTGAVETAISFYTQKFNSLQVLAITSEIPSLYHQVLPKDINYVIINSEGKVLYHSIQEKNLHENFVLECESNLKLINAINLRKKDIIKINYNERSWLARIVPIKDTPLYHITLLDLNQTDNKNARIFLFTFYFFIATLFIMVIGLMIIRWIYLAQNKEQKNTWFLNWLVLHPGKFFLYKNLTIILLIIILAQLSVLAFENKPITILVYQLIFIIYTLFVSMTLLNRKEQKLEKSVFREFLNELNILIVTVLLILFFVWKFELTKNLLFPLLILLFITLFILRILKNMNPGKMLTINQNSLTELKIKRTYLGFLFLWLASISAVPVIVYYYSVKGEEEKYWKKEQLYKVAQDNINLQTIYQNPDKEWFKRLQGTGIDNLSVSYTELSKNFDLKSTDSKQNDSYADTIYRSLPDPITNWYNQPKLTTSNSFISSHFENDTLFFKKGLQNGAISVNYTQDKYLFSVGSYLVLIVFVFLIVSLCVWFLLKYLASVLLNLNKEKLTIPAISWFEIFSNKSNNRIILNSFGGLCYLEKSKEYLKNQSSGKEEILTMQASEFISPDFDIKTLPADSNSTIWINGFNQVLDEFDKHETLLSILINISKNCKAKIIFYLPFDIELINEFYDDYITANELNAEKLANIFVLRKKWKNLFSQYINFNGYLNQNNNSNSENIRIEDDYKIGCEDIGIDDRFPNIWSNLTTYEKIVLYDLADDGLLNRKNKTMIQKLINKRLIIPDPYPHLFSEEFRNFVQESIKSTEVQVMENKLGLNGSWHNAKYLILLILVPLAAFIIISQGIAIEKVFGIFAGGLAIITGITRLFDSNLFKQS